jgi:hypothetical protein
MGGSGSLWMQKSALRGAVDTERRRRARDRRPERVVEAERRASRGCCRFTGASADGGQAQAAAGMHWGTSDGVVTCQKGAAAMRSRQAKA